MVHKSLTCEASLGSLWLIIFKNKVQDMMKRFYPTEILINKKIVELSILIGKMASVFH